MKNKIFSLLIIIVSFFFLNACSNSDNKKLSIEEDKLVEIFYDLHSAQIIVNQANKKIKDSLTEVYTNQIFKIHKVTKFEFEKNVQILQANPKEFKSFYDKLDKYGENLLKKLEEETKPLKE